MFIQTVTDADQIETVAGLAQEIWREHYTPLIGAAQVQYMLDTRQSPQAIAGAIQAGTVYLLIHSDQEACGYAAMQLLDDTALLLDKFYIKASCRKQGLGGQLFTSVKEFACQKQCHSIQLTVNRHNQLAVQVYTSLGFRKTGTVVQDIGQGFLMDDFKMALEISAEERKATRT